MHNPAGINRAAAAQTKNPMAKKSQTTQSSSDRNIDIPPVSKSTAGAATGAVVGAMAGPMGAVVGGVIGAVLGKRAQDNKPLIPEAGTKAVVKTAKAALPAAKRVLKSVTPGRSKSRGAKKSTTAKKSPAKKTAAKKTSRTKSSPARAKKSAGSSTRGKSTSKKRR